MGPKDSTGLGRLGEELRALLGLGYHLVPPSEQLEQHELIAPFEVPLDPGCSEDELKTLLSGLKGIIFPERYWWHRKLMPAARELGLYSICVPTWEWFGVRDRGWGRCSAFVCQTQFTLKHLRKFGWNNSVYIPATINLSRFPARCIEGPARLFVHNAGVVNPDDRKGTRETILAFKKVKLKDIRLRVHLQKEAPLPDLDERIELRIGNLANPADLYAEGDVAVQPSKLEGIGYALVEAVCSGMPVITTDYPPMNEYAQQKEMLVRPRWFKRRAFPSQWHKWAHLRLPDINDLARKIQWCAGNDMGPISKANLELRELLFSPAKLRRGWQELVEAMESGRLDEYIREFESAAMAAWQ